jgi:hypothetical protein
MLAAVTWRDGLLRRSTHKRNRNRMALGTQTADVRKLVLRQNDATSIGVLIVLGPRDSLD